MLRWFPEFFLLFQKDLEELFDIRGKFFNFLVLVSHLLCAGEEVLSRCFKQNLHSCPSDVVVPLERLPMCVRELAVLFEELKTWFEILQFSLHKLLLLPSLNPILCAIATYEHRGNCLHHHLQVCILVTFSGLVK